MSSYSKNKIIYRVDASRSNFSSENQRPRSVNHPSTSMPTHPTIINDSTPPVVVLKCFSNGYEPINIILQNQPAANRSTSAPSSVQIPSSANRVSKYLNANDNSI